MCYVSLLSRLQQYQVVFEGEDPSKKPDKYLRKDGKAAGEHSNQEAALQRRVAAPGSRWLTKATELEPRRCFSPTTVAVCCVAR